MCGPKTLAVLAFVAAIALTIVLILLGEVLDPPVCHEGLATAALFTDCRRGLE